MPDWKRKLTSRKLWVSICGFAALLLTAYGADQRSVTEAVSVIMAGATVIGYVIGEGLADSKNASDDGTGETFIMAKGLPGAKITVDNGNGEDKIDGVPF